MHRILVVAISCLLLGITSPFQPHPAYGADSRVVRTLFDVQGVERMALVYPNAGTAPAAGAPLLFYFHGHGGTARSSADKHRIHERWPEAIVVYMQGIPGVVGINDPEGEANGWQKNPGELEDRDINFVDVALAQLQRQYSVDPNRVYAMGFSNGGRFTNLLWNMRGERFAAFTSAGSGGADLIQRSLPRSTFIIAGEKDERAPYELQLLNVAAARLLLQTEPSQAVTAGLASFEPGPGGLELGTYLHSGAHILPQKSIPHAVAFFKRHTRP